MTSKNKHDNEDSERESSGFASKKIGRDILFVSWTTRDLIGFDSVTINDKEEADDEDVLL